jgi:hypothetical protein
MSRSGGGDTPAFYTALTVAAATLFGALFMVTDSIGAASIPVWGIAMGGVAIVLRGPVGKALARRIGGDDEGAIPPELPAEILGELDDLRHRVLELEERVDFSERLLAQGRAGDQEVPRA